jgi:hypothetical protein
MASFTDIQPQFTPYVHQLPVEAMVQVGMEKQKRYDEGVQKIQTNIDNIAGLDVIRDVDKNYLQSKLNELGSRLKTVAAGDFSNFQLVNSVSGMANQIVKDPTIQSGVQSTQVIRRGQQEKESANKAGKGSVQNDSYWDSQVNSFLNNKDLNAKFNGSYVEYTDVDKKLREVADKVHEIDNSIDIPYKRDAQGNVLYFNSAGQVVSQGQGVPKVDDAMLSIKTKGKPAEKILANFYDSLNENDQRQLKIDSWYHYRGATAETFKADATKNYNEQKKLLSNELVNLNLELTTNSKLSSVDKSKVQARINDINTTLSDGTLDKQLQSQIAEIGTGDAESYKYKLYTQKYLTNLAKDMSYQSYEQEIKTNPYAQMDMEKKRLDFQYQNARREQSNFEASLNWQKDKFFAEQAGKKQAATPVVIPGRVSTDIMPPALIDVDKQITDLKGNLNELSASYAPTLIDPTLKTPQQKKAYLDGLAKKYSEDPSSIDQIKDNNVRQYLEKRRVLEIELGQKQNLLNGAIAHVAGFDKQIDQALGSELGVTFKDGATLYTAKQLYDFSKQLNDFYKTSPKATGTFKEKQDIGRQDIQTSLDVNALLSSYKGTKQEPLARAFAKRYLGEELSATEKVLINRTNTITQKFDPQIAQITNNKLQTQSDYLAQRMPERQTAIGTLDLKTNKQDASMVEQLIGNKLIELSQGGVDVEKAGQFDPSTLQKFRKDPQATYTIEKKYDGSANLIITSDGAQQIVPMNASEFSSYFPAYSRKNPVNDIKYAVLASPNKTTNLIGGTDASAGVNAYLSGYDLPNLSSTGLAPMVRVDVEGSPFNDGSANDKFQVRMYVNDNGHWKTDIITQQGYVTDAGVRDVLNNIGPNTVSDLLKKNK